MMIEPAARDLMQDWCKKNDTHVIPMVVLYSLIKRAKLEEQWKAEEAKIEIAWKTVMNTTYGPTKATPLPAPSWVYTTSSNMRYQGMGFNDTL